MSQIIFATGNNHKLIEVNKLLEKTNFSVVGLHQMHYFKEIVEDGLTLEDNALIKARTIHKEFGDDVFSEDTGLEIFSLGNEPGVHTARYAGPENNAEDNMNKVLLHLKDHSDRSAQFRTVIALILENQEYLFEGIAKGKIAAQKSGEGGFGYDPIFIPEGYDVSFAELDAATKNKISHRGNAVRKLIAFLTKNASKV